jgi:8-oxo-dGTP pyrophosphatase MutT (NUDIX family)
MPSAAPPAWYSRLLANLGELRNSYLGSLRPMGDGEVKHSAVLVLFGNGPDGPDLLLTERSAQLRSHAGQVAFPGGRIDPTDAGPEAAALREAQEETGADPAGIEVSGLAPRLCVPVTNYWVTPVVAWWRTPSPVSAVDPLEVARAVRIPVAELVDPANRFYVTHPSGLIGPGFRVRELFVWGFTAGVVDRLLDLAGLEQPWDRARRVRLPRQPTPGQVMAVQAVPDPPETPADRSAMLLPEPGRQESTA